MEAKVESAIQTLEQWANGDSDNRAVVCIVFEREKEIQDATTTQVHAEVMNYNHGDEMNLVLAFTTALQQNDKYLAKIIMSASRILQEKSFKTIKQ